MQKINDILAVFAKANSKYDSASFYRFSNLSENPNEDIEAAFRNNPNVKPHDLVNITLLQNWREELFTKYPDNERSWLHAEIDGYPSKGKAGKDYIIDLILETLGSLPTHVYYVEVDSNGYYACSDEEYIFRTNEGLYLYSMQKHD